MRVFNVKTARRGGRDLHTACHDGRFRLGCIDSVAGNKKQMFRLQNLVSNFEKCKSFFDLESANINKPFFKSTKIWLMKGSHTVLLSDSFSYFLPHIRILAMILWNVSESKIQTATEYWKRVSCGEPSRYTTSNLNLPSSDLPVLVVRFHCNHSSDGTALAELHLLLLLALRLLALKVFYDSQILNCFICFTKSEKYERSVHWTKTRERKRMEMRNFQQTFCENVFNGSMRLVLDRRE